MSGTSVCVTVELSVKKGYDIELSVQKGYDIVELSVKTEGYDIPEILCVVKKVSKLVTHFSRSTISVSKLKILTVLFSVLL